jgi:hypothetical protein
MTQEMADIVGAVAGVPACEARALLLEKSAPELYGTEMLRCLDGSLIVRMDATGDIQVTGHGWTVRQAAIASGEVQA